MPSAIYKRLFSVSGTAVLMFGICPPAVAEPLPGRFQVVSGQLLAGGAPVSGDVTVLAWPTVETLAKLSKGQHATAIVVQHVHTGSDGKFGVSVDPARLPSEYATRRGQVDLELMMVSGGRQASWFTSATRSAGFGRVAATQGRAASTWTMPTARRGNVPLRFDLSGGSLDFDVSKSKKDSVNQLAVAFVNTGLTPSGGNLRSRPWRHVSSQQTRLTRTSKRNSQASSPGVAQRARSISTQAVTIL